MNLDKYKEQFNNLKKEAMNPSKTSYSRKKLLFQWIAILAILLVLYFCFSALTKKVNDNTNKESIFSNNVIVLTDNSTITVEE